MEFFYFLGRFHVLALHLPIGIILVTIALELVTRRQSFRELESAAPFLWVASAISAITTVVLGYLHFLEGGFHGASATKHMITGTCVAVITTLAWLLRSKFKLLYERVSTVIAIALVVLVTLTGHYGGNLTHGPTYLIEYAPNTIRSMAGLEARRPPVVELAAADVFLDVVQPMLKARCTNCHNDARKKGELNLSTFQELMAGGKSGAAIVPGDPVASELWRRINLARDHEDFMPSDGKTPLTEAETKVIGWWIGAGAPFDMSLANLDISDVEGILPGILMLDGGGTSEATRDEISIDYALLDRLIEADFQARPISRGDGRLVVSLAHTPNKMLSDNQLQVLSGERTQVVELNLRQSGVRDEHLPSIAEFSNLSRLTLAYNAITDEGLRNLTGLEQLNFLSLVGNQNITDESIAVFAELEGLRHLYLWQTDVTEAGVTKLREQAPNLVVDLGIQ